MNNAEEFDFWWGEYFENPKALDSETWRLFADMCRRGNSHALAHLESLEQEERRVAAERGGKDERDVPLNTVGNLDDKEDGLFAVTSYSQSNYPNKWSSIATSIKNSRNWRCEECAFQKPGSGLIQVHHIDGDKADNQDSNLQVLCAICHGEKHGNPAVWLTGASDEDKAKLFAHHRSRDF